MCFCFACSEFLPTLAIYRLVLSAKTSSRKYTFRPPILQGVSIFFLLYQYKVVRAIPKIFIVSSVVQYSIESPITLLIADTVLRASSAPVCLATSSAKLFKSVTLIVIMMLPFPCSRTCSIKLIKTRRIAASYYLVNYFLVSLRFYKRIQPICRLCRKTLYRHER